MKLNVYAEEHQSFHELMLPFLIGMAGNGVRTQKQVCF